LCTVPSFNLDRRNLATIFPSESGMFSTFLLRPIPPRDLPRTPRGNFRSIATARSRRAALTFSPRSATIPSPTRSNSGARRSPQLNRSIITRVRLATSVIVYGERIAHGKRPAESATAGRPCRRSRARNAAPSRNSNNLDKCLRGFDQSATTAITKPGKSKRRNILPDDAITICQVSSIRTIGSIVPTGSRP
jgi:hypothetical protein